MTDYPTIHADITPAASEVKAEPTPGPYNFHPAYENPDAIQRIVDPIDSKPFEVYRRVIAKGETILADVLSYRAVTDREMGWPHASFEVTEANANLFLAAPDLLAACEAVLNDGDGCDGLMIETIAALASAVAKARGEAL